MQGYTDVLQSKPYSAQRYTQTGIIHFLGSGKQMGKMALFLRFSVYGAQILILKPVRYSEHSVYFMPQQAWVQMFTRL